jgi:hypothetical protein
MLSKNIGDPVRIKSFLESIGTLDWKDAGVSIDALCREASLNRKSGPGSFRLQWPRAGCWRRRGSRPDFLSEDSLLRAQGIAKFAESTSGPHRILAVW